MESPEYLGWLGEQPEHTILMGLQQTPRSAQPARCRTPKSHPVADAEGAMDGLEQCHDSLEFGLKFSGSACVFIKLAANVFELDARVVVVARTGR